MLISTTIHNLNCLGQVRDTSCVKCQRLNWLIGAKYWTRPLKKNQLTHILRLKLLQEQNSKFNVRLNKF